MNIQMRHIGILRLLLTLVGFVDENVEPVCVEIPAQHALKLLFMQLHQFLNCLAESFQKPLRNMAIRSRPGSNPKQLRFALV